MYTYVFVRTQKITYSMRSTVNRFLLDLRIRS